MRQFSSSGFRLWNLSLEAKLVYSCFALFALAALACSALFYEDLVGRSGVSGYYNGEPAPATGNRAAGGPAIELPDEKPAPLTVAVTYRKLLEVTHFHLFTVPVFLLILAHLFMQTALSTRAKALWIVGGWLSAALHLAAPWLVRYAGGGWAPLYAASGAALGVTSAMLTLYPVWAMWRGAPGERAATSSG